MQQSMWTISGLGSSKRVNWGDMPLKIGYIIGTYPLITTTFIDREIQGLRERGIEIAILSIRRPPAEVERMQEYKAVRQSTVYLLPVNWVRLILAHLYFAAARPLAYWWLLGYLVSRTHPNLKQRAKTIFHFAAGVYAAYLLRDEACDHLHAHFVDRAATVALCASRLLGKPYSVTAHANDLYAGPVLLFEKFKHAQFAVTVSKFNKEHILENCPGLDAQRMIVLHPWVNLNEFQPPATRPQNRRLAILSVGRLVEKKGHRYLINACRLLRDQGLHIDCRIVGSGPLENELRALVGAQGMVDCIQFEGSRSKVQVLRWLAQADVFVLASVIAQDGDRDGMPVALAEAMAMQVPVISTNIVGIGELVQPGSGCLVTPKDPVALAQAIESIHRMDQAARREMGKQGRAIVESDFEVNQGLDRLAEMFKSALPIDGSDQGFANSRMSNTRNSDLRTAFIVWGAPSIGPRSQVLARELDIESLHFVRAGARRGILSAPLRYVYQAGMTIRILLRDQPRVVFVQSPPSFAVLCVHLYCRITGARYLIDAHSSALLQREWMWPRWMHRTLLRGAITTIVTNEHFEALIRAEGGRAFVLRDVPSQFDSQSFYPLNGTFKIAIVNTFQNDEPLEEILAAARDLPEMDFYITGKKQMARAEIFAQAPTNAHFTGFLPDPAYYALLAGADAVMCLTTREHTMQRGACEALSLGKPIITSDTQLLRNYFDRGTAHVPNTRSGIRAGILQIQANLARYQAEILELRNERRREWQVKKQALAGLIHQELTQRDSLERAPGFRRAHIRKDIVDGK